MDKWIYFGCHKQAGHYTFSEGMRSLSQRYGSHDLSRFDGMLPPQTDTTPYIATVSRLGGWGFTALAFWDYSVDKRGGCNSVVFAPSLTIAPDDLLAEAERRFPEVFGRLPQPVRLMTQNEVMSDTDEADAKVSWSLAMQLLKQAQSENEQCAYWFVSALSKLAGSHSQRPVIEVLALARHAMPTAAEQYADYVKDKS